MGKALIGIILLAENVYGSDRFQTNLHLSKRMLDQRFVVVAPAIRYAVNTQTVLVSFIPPPSPGCARSAASRPPSANRPDNCISPFRRAAPGPTNPSIRSEP